MKKRELKAVNTARSSSASSATRGRSANSSRSTSASPCGFWFTFWHRNVHSMLTEVTFCLTCYLNGAGDRSTCPSSSRMAAAEEAPLDAPLRVRAAQGDGVFASWARSCRSFHQGSLGGSTASLQGRPSPSASRSPPGPSTFFLFVLIQPHRRSGAELRPRHHLGRLEGLGAGAGEARGLRSPRPRSGSSWSSTFSPRPWTPSVWINHTSFQARRPPARFLRLAPSARGALFRRDRPPRPRPALPLVLPADAAQPPDLVPAASWRAQGVAMNRFRNDRPEPSPCPPSPSTPSCPHPEAGRRWRSFVAVIAYGVILCSCPSAISTSSPRRGKLGGSPEV